MHRAAHQLYDRPLVFDDPLALAVIGREAETELRAGTDWHGFAAPSLRAFIVARARYTEDMVASGVARGVSQYLLLGAGLDTYACRRPADTPVVFEVDHPATQAWKRERLLEAGIAAPSHLVSVPVDFERESLQMGLDRAEFDFAKPAVAAWLGVTPYLARETVLATLGFLATRLMRGSELVFDYAEPVDGRDPLHRARFARLAERVAKAGEPFRCFFEPAGLHAALRELGIRNFVDHDAPALDARYFAGRADGLSIGGHGHLLHARW
jgi:methyltransferase (TIGR00027 family)